MVYGTLSTTEPTTLPTAEPTTDPTNASPTTRPTPTQDPSISQTSPTSDPTSDPTIDAIVAYTADPTTDPTIEPTPAPSPRLEVVNSTESNLSDTTLVSSSKFYQYVVFGLLGLSLLVITVSYVDARCIGGRMNDFYSASALFNATFQILDLVSDLFFCAELLSLSHRFINLAIASAVFIVIPSILSIVQLYLAVQRWRSTGNDILTAWLFNYAFGLYALSLLTGNAFIGVQICRSDMCGLPQFAMPLSHNQIIEFQSKKLWSTVMLEVECFIHFAICFRIIHRNN